MPSLHDLYCGRLLHKRRIVSAEQLWSALRKIHEAHQRGRVLGLVEALKAEGLITDRHARKLSLATKRHQLLVQEKMLARQILRDHLVPRDRLREVIDEQRDSKFQKGLGPMLVERGLVSDAKLAELRAGQAVDYAQTVGESEGEFLGRIATLEPPFSKDEEFKVLDMLGLAPGRTQKTENFFSSEDNGKSGEREPEWPRGESGEFAAPTSLLESTDSTEPEPPPPPDQLASVNSDLRPEDCPIYGYEIIEELGKGAMGVVYKARHIFSDRVTALKVLPLRLARDSQYLERFKREAIACMRLQHENIVRAYDFGGSEDYYYLALEFIDGTTLDHLLEHGPIVEQDALKIIRGVASGLDFAWQQRVLHRDIKPENIMITRDGDAKLCDFGIVKLVDMNNEASVTMAGTTVGTPYYISPEQARGEDDLDIRSDLYSLGVTLFHTLTGDVPFTGNSQGAILVRHILEEVPSPKTMKPDLSDEVCAIVGRLCQKSRDDRYQSPSELIAAIDHLPQRA